MKTDRSSPKLKTKKQKSAGPYQQIASLALEVLESCEITVADGTTWRNSIVVACFCH